METEKGEGKTTDIQVVPNETPIEEVKAETPNSEITPELVKRKLPKKLILLLVLILIGASAYSFYFNFWKSPKRVLAKMVESIAQVNAYEYSALFDVTNTGNLGTNKYSVKISGKNDSLNPDEPKIATEIEGFTNDFKVVGIEAVSVNQVMFAKLSYLLNLGFNADELKNIWVKVDFNELMKTYMGEEIEMLEREDGQNISQEDRDKVYAILKDYPIFSVAKNFGKEELNGVEMYHFKVLLNEENATRAIEAIQEEINLGFSSNSEQTSDEFMRDIRTFFNNFEFNNGEIWVGVDDTLPYKLMFEMKIVNSDYGNLEVKSNIGISNYNKGFEITAPSEFMSLEEFLGKAMNIFNNIQQQYNQNLENSPGVSINGINPENMTEDEMTESMEQMLGI